MKLIRDKRRENYAKQNGSILKMTPAQRRRTQKKERHAFAREAMRGTLNSVPSPCPVCGSLLDAPCITKTGKPAKAPHKGRAA